MDMDQNSPLALVGRGLEQVAFVVRDLGAAQKFFSQTMGISRFYVIENFGRRATDKTFRGRTSDHNFSIAIAYSGDTQIELIQHLSGDTCYKEFIERRGEGLQHLGFFLDDREQYGRALAEFGRNGYSVLQSGRFGEAVYTYFDTETAIGAVMEIVYLDRSSRELMARVKRGEF
jgi:catechol 2,3-dioxygenase-like lactoylglutathione lyase family enzyme